MKICKRLRWRNAMVKSDGSGSRGLTPHAPACVIDTVRLSMAQTRTPRSQATCTSVLPASKTPVNQKKIYHLNTLHLYPTKTNKERITEFLYQAVELSTSDCSILTENEGLVQIKVTITNHDVGPDYTRHQPKLHGSLPSEYTLY